MVAGPGLVGLSKRNGPAQRYRRPLQPMVGRRTGWFHDATCQRYFRFLSATERRTALPSLSTTESLSPTGRTMAGCVNLAVFGVCLLQMPQSTTRPANAPSPLHRRSVGFVKEVHVRLTRSARALHGFAQVIRNGKRTCVFQVVPL